MGLDEFSRRACERWTRFRMGSEAVLLITPVPPDLRIRYGVEPPNFCDLRLPRGPGPHSVVAVIHGGFWRNRYDLQHISHLCAALTAQGMASWSIEYRRLGDPGGGFSGTFLDVAAALKHLRTIAPTYNLDLEHVITLGHSAGGHLALWAAGARQVPPSSPIHVPDPLRVRAAVSLAGVLDLARASALRLSSSVTDELLGGTREQVPDHYAAASPIELLPLGIPQFLLHGTADENVPFEISRRYYDAARARGDAVTLITLEGVGHFELIDPRSRVWPRLLQVMRTI